MARLRVLVLMGGPSTEHDVSVVSGTGVVPDNTAAYVMNNAMAAVLSGTPKASTVVAGFVLENGMINGIPVYITEYAPANTVYFPRFLNH